MKIVISSYRPEWKTLFRKESEMLQQQLSEWNPIIEHIGSTAVEGLAAKAIFDIMIGLPDEKCFPEIVPQIISMNYLYVKKYESILPERRFFIKLKEPFSYPEKIIEPDGEIPDIEKYVRTYHLHVIRHGSTFWNRHIAFRDHLRTNLEDLKQYDALKRHLSEREWQNSNEFADAKEAFIRAIEKKIGY